MLKKPKKISIGQCFGCPFVAANLEEGGQTISITCGFPGQEGRRIDRPSYAKAPEVKPRVNKIDRDGVV